MSETSNGQLPLFGDSGASRAWVPTDHAARVFATDPRHNVVLEASAGTGKTTVLVGRYLNLLRADVNPANVLAMTFTRQAAAEMRSRIIAQLRQDAEESTEGRKRWDTIRDRLGEIAISTVDAFCLSLLREYPLEADLDPGFGMADDTEVPQLVEDAVDRTLVVGAALAKDDPGVAMLLAQLGPFRTRVALTNLLERRLVVPAALHRFLAGSPRGLSGDSVCRDAARRLADRIGGARRALNLLLETGPADDPRFALVGSDLTRLSELAEADAPRVRGSLDRIREFFLTQKGTVRAGFGRGTSLSGPERRRFQEAASELAPLVSEVLRGLDRDVNVVMVGAVQRLFGVAVSEYRRGLDSRALLDFSDVLQRAVELLRQMDEFARSRYRLESRYHHVLVDEFQDTSRAQWELVSLLVQAWGEGSGLGEESVLPPSIFIVGDRKQSIYRFRDADVSVFRAASSAISGLRPDGDVRRSIAHSFRAVPKLLAFVNDLFEEIGAASDAKEGFSFDPQDRFPTDQTRPTADASERTSRPLGLVVAADLAGCAEAVAAEVERLLKDGRLPSKDGSGPRPVKPGDIAVLFRARASHREFEWALEQRSIPTYVYKGLGFFDADEIKDVRALIRFLADPASDLRAAALLRSRLAGLSDPAIVALAGRLSDALVADAEPSAADTLEADDRRRLVRLRAGLSSWIGLVDRFPPAEVLDRVLHEAAYAFELRGRHVIQARENVKKMRSLVRRLQNRGYATMARISDQVDHLADDISTAVVEAYDAVNFSTVHAAKGLEFPIVFLVDLGRGTGSQAPAVRVIPDRGDGQPSVTVWPYRSAADLEERQRDLGETKRLLYVAATRARDRLYLSAALKDGQVSFNRGSFGEVLPLGLAAAFERALGSVPGTTSVDWQGGGGRRHEFRSLTPDDASAGGVSETEPIATDAPSPPVDLAPVAVRSTVERATVTAVSSVPADPEKSSVSQASSRVLGRVVHQLLQRFFETHLAVAELEARARRILRLELPLGFGLDRSETELLVGRAADLYARIRSHPDIQALRGQECLFEVPFAYYDSSTLLSGTIDCLARASDGSVTALEFKTGAPHPRHEQQLSRYVAAARALMPETPVKGRLIYPGRSERNR